MRSTVRKALSCGRDATVSSCPRAVRFALSCLLAIMLAACSQEAQPGPPWAPDSFAREWLDAFSSHDIDRLLAYYTEDALLEDVPIVENRGIAPARGHEMIRELLVPMFEEMPDLGFQFVSASSAGDRMVVEWVMTGRRVALVTGPAFATPAPSRLHRPRPQLKLCAVSHTNLRRTN